MKKILSIMLALVMLLTVLPLGAIPVSAATSGTTGDCTWTLEDGHLTISGNGKMGDYYSWGDLAPWGESIASVTIEQGVTTIGRQAFSGCVELTSITIPDSLITIDTFAFEYCRNLTAVTIPDSVISLGNFAFAFCTGLTSITIPDSVSTIGSYAFSNCDSLTTVTIPDSVTTIQGGAFDRCKSLTAVTIPDSVISLGDFVFAGCDSLTAINVSEDNPNYSSAAGVLFNKDKTALIAYPAGKAGSYNIPDGVITIKNSAFSSKLLTSVTMPNSITTIEDWAFSPCEQLTSITMGDKVTSIGKGAFHACDKLTHVYYGGNKADKTKMFIDSINDALLNAAWHYAKEDLSSLQYTIANEQAIITGYIGELPDVLVIPNTIEGYPVTTIAEDAFSYCFNLTSVVILNGVTSIGEGAFAGCVYLTSVTLPDSITAIGAGAFNRCERLTSITIPDGVTTIEDTTFYDCYHLSTVSIPDSVAYIGHSAFSGCDNLATVYYEGGRDDKAKITIKPYNSELLNATWRYANEPPFGITAQPQSTQVKNGETAKVTVTAEGDGLTYTWYIKNKGASKYSKSSVKTNTYSVKMSSASRDRYLYCVIKDKYGNKVQSNTVALRMAATITKQPATAFAKRNAIAKVTLTAAGDGLTYQWYVKNPGATEYAVSSVKSATYSAKMTEASSGRLVYCVVTDKYGHTAQTKTVVMRMQASVVTQPKSVKVKNGTTAKVTIKAAGEGLTYTWYIKNKGAKSFTKSSVKTNTYSVKMSTKVNGRQVYCVVKDKYGKTVKSTTVSMKKK